MVQREKSESNKSWPTSMPFLYVIPSAVNSHAPRVYLKSMDCKVVDALRCPSLTGVHERSHFSP